MEVAEGDFTLVAGPSAGGKSTFLRLFNGLVPQFHGGRLAGSVTVSGLDASRTPARVMASRAGMVFQEPEAQSVALTVEEDLVFGMEQQGVPPSVMEARASELLGQLGIVHLRSRRLATLSGGERQRSAIAAALALAPQLLLCDEPTSQLDPGGAADVMASLATLHRAGRTTLLISEHRLDRLLPVVSSVVEIREGRLRSATPLCAARWLEAVPPHVELARALGISPIPLTLDAARAALSARPAALGATSPGAPPAPGDQLLAARGLAVSFGDTRVLHDIDISLAEGEVIVLLGPNGSGKTTLLRSLVGLQSIARGSVAFRGRQAPSAVQERAAFAGYVPQDPAVALYRQSVRDEVADGLRHRDRARQTRDVLREWSVEELSDSNPRDVSVGQQLRVALASLLAHNPPVWLMDEPTRGADATVRRFLATRIREHAARGGAAIVATHDIEAATHFATRVIRLDSGGIAFDLPSRAAFGHGGPCETAIASLVPGALTLEEVLV
ncbi:MAG: ABC transporter ATP-binding protein [Dehalococcoidia bacterium]